MEYANVHHLWRPLAAISSREEVNPVISVPTTILMNLSTPARILKTSTSSTVTPTVAEITSSPQFDESNDILANLYKNITYGAFNATDDIADSYEMLNTSLVINGSNICNVSLCITDGIFMNPVWTIISTVGTSVALGLIILATVIGNVFVIAAILLERNLQNVANYLILSLAVADLLVACLVMPLGAVYEVSHQWTLGPELCDMWTSSDVLCCTASILHLVAIALDRYWAVTNIDYIHQRTAKRIGLMILVIWSVAFLVCIAPAAGWKDSEWYNRVENKTCLVSQELSYQIFATSSSFYLPLLVILILYWRIFQTARKRIRRRQAVQGAAAAANKNMAAGGIAGGLAAASGTGGIAAAVVTIIGRPLPTISETTTAFTTVSSNNTSPEKTSFANGLEADLPTTTDCSMSYQPQHYPTKRKSKDSADSKRERKAAKTLAIITGAFVMCWLPFFVMAVLLPIKKDLFEDYIISTFLWLGYFNSTLNPIIYTIFSPEFRHAFKKILCGRNYARRKNRHLGIRHFQ